MASWVWVGFAAFFFVALAVGIRLLLLARRTRQLPELLMGIGVLGIGPIGFGFMVAGTQMGASPGVRTLLVGIGLLAVSTGAFAKCIFNWRVYHPDSRAVRALVAALGLFLFGSFLYSGLATGFADARGGDTTSLPRSAIQIFCLLWGATESFLYWLRMRKRMRLGLADPLVTNRFLMWAIGAGAAGVGTAVGTAAQLAYGVTITAPSWVMASSSLHGLVAAIAIALAFMPPAPYRRWISSHAA